MTLANTGINSSRVKLTPFDFAGVNVEEVPDDHPLKPIYLSGGLLLPITPTVTETLQANYEQQEIPQNNESFHVYKNTSNRQISLGDIVFPADTIQDGRYALAAIHFFRTYSLSSFGVGGTGRPPSPMWFSGFGKFIYHKVPTLLTASTLTFGGQDVDLVPVPSPGGTDTETDQTDAIDAAWSKKSIPANRFSSNLETERRLAIERAGVDVNWIPIKLTVGGVSLTVQHSPLYWKTFSLEDYRKGKLVEEEW